MPTPTVQPTVHRLATIDRSHTLGGPGDIVVVLLVEHYESAMVSDPLSRRLTPGFEIHTTNTVAYGNVVYAASQAGPEHVAVLLRPIDGSRRWALVDLGHPPIDPEL